MNVTLISAHVQVSLLHTDLDAFEYILKGGMLFFLFKTAVLNLNFKGTFIVISIVKISATSEG